MTTETEKIADRAILSAIFAPMNILYRGNTFIEDIPVTQAAEHEEELMKSDFVKLSWNDTDFVVLPTDAYIQPFDNILDTDGQPIKYSLLEPYEPEQKSECEWQYEPKFQHPKMYLGKVPFAIDSTDSAGNPQTLIDWPYYGSLASLLEYFCEVINNVFGFTTEEQKFNYAILGNVEGTVNISFSSQDILSALGSLASKEECEYHLDWQTKTLFFGHIIIDHGNLSVPVLAVGENIQKASVKSSKEGFWNAYQPQGSSRNISRKASKGENVQCNVRVSLKDREYVFTDLDGTEKTIQTTDGIVYTDDDGHIVTKEEFEAAGKRKLVKPVVFEDVYPRQELYVHDVRCRMLYVLNDDDKSRVSYKDAQGRERYKTHALWYVKLSYYDGTTWHRYALYDYASSINFESAGAIKMLVSYHGENGIVRNEKYYYAIKLSDLSLVEDVYTVGYHTENNGTTPWKVLFLPPQGQKITYKIGNETREGILYHKAKNGPQYFNTNFYIYEVVPDGKSLDDFDFYLLVGEGFSAEQDARNDTSAKAVYDTLKAAGEIVLEEFPVKHKLLRDVVSSTCRRSQEISGKDAIMAFQPNTYKRATGNIVDGIEDYVLAESCPLAGRGSGDGDGHYGFKFGKILTENDVEKERGIRNDDVATTVDQLPRVDIGDFVIRWEEKDDYFLPTTPEQGIIPKGCATTDLNTIGEDGKVGNKVNIYNIISDDAAEYAAECELAKEVSKYIKNAFIDDNNYTFKSDPVAFDEHNPELYIGRKVIYRNIASDDLETRVIKLITKLDFAFEQEITVGNEVLKSNQQTLKDKVDTIFMGGGGTGAGGGTMSIDYFKTVISNYGRGFFISKIADDITTGVIGFTKGLWVRAKGLFGIDEDGNAKVNDLSAVGNADISGSLSAGGEGTIGGSMTVGGALSAGGNASVGGNLSVSGTTKTQGVSSANYTGDGIGDTGFSLTSNYNGHSKLTVDELYVRIKAVFESLEVKKALVTGGNHVQSCAANVIVRTDFIDNSGHIIGYETLKVPYMSSMRAFILRNKYYAKKKTIRKVLTAEEFANVDKVRCYFLAEEGGRKIDNWWQAGDLARCMTYNVTQANRETFVVGTQTKQGNIHWWRRVMAVSSTPAEIDGKSYHWFDVSVRACMQGSDIPAAGDDVCQWGNISNPDRMNLIVSEVNGTAAFKMYVGIYTFSDTLCWYGGDACKVNVSPSGGVKVVSNMFQLITEYGEAPVPMERGKWIEIAETRDDYYPHSLVRKCYYYDKVSHIGSYWLCIHATEDNAHWVRPQQWDNNSYKLFDNKGRYLNNGDYLPDDEYNALDDDKKSQCGRVTDYTTEEPSESSTDWQMAVEKGEAGEDSLHVEIWGMDIIRNGVGRITLEAHAFKGSEDITYSLLSTAFSWIKESEDHNSDSNWNALHANYGNVVTIASADILKRANISCVVNYELMSS